MKYKPSLKEQSMAKNKKKKKNKVLNERKFIRKYCKACRLCRCPQPDFCFKELYLVNPQIFVNEVFQKLVRLPDWPVICYAETETFRDIFCSETVCDQAANRNGIKCTHTLECLRLFRDQINHKAAPPLMTTAANFVTKYTKGKNKKKRKEKRLPVVTCILSDNEEWRERVDRILHGSNNKQQGAATTDSG